MDCIYSAVYKLYLFLPDKYLEGRNSSFSSLSSSICLSIHPFIGHLSVYVLGSVMNLGMDIIFSLRDLIGQLGQWFPTVAACRNHLGCWLHS